MCKNRLTFNEEVQRTCSPTLYSDINLLKQLSSYTIIYVSRMKNVIKFGDVEIYKYFKY